MGFACGLVGLPNAGKSTLFNALTRSAQAAVADFPFCTIDPNEATAPVPDARLDALAATAASARTVPARLEFVDIAGLVEGASDGEGLGNRFLAHVREVDAIAHVLRCFALPGRGDAVEPEADWETVTTELLLADLERTEKMLGGLARKVRAGDDEALRDARLLEQALAALRDGRPAGQVDVDEPDRTAWRRLGLLTAKPTLIVANVDGLATDRDASQLAAVEALARRERLGLVRIPAAVEAELVEMGPEEASSFLAELEISQTGLDRFIEAGYRLLDRITFFTAGPKETRAWPLPRGATARQAAARIHTDFARGFIRAETVDWQTFVDHGGEGPVRSKGLMRSEGRSYVVQDGDVIRFRFSS